MAGCCCAGSFKYERREFEAYSLNVNAEFNRNNLINTHIEFDPLCPGFNHS